MLECEIRVLFIFLNFRSPNVGEVFNNSIKNLLEHVKEENVVSKFEYIF
jgi:hypothetical protein